MRQVPSPGLSPHPGTQFHPAHPVTGWQGLLSGKVWLPVVSYTFSNFIYGKPAHSTASSMFSVSVRTVSCTGLNHLTPHEEQLTQNQRGDFVRGFLGMAQSNGYKDHQKNSTVPQVNTAQDDKAMFTSCGTPRFLSPLLEQQFLEINKSFRLSLFSRLI